MIWLDLDSLQSLLVLHSPLLSNIGSRSVILGQVATNLYSTVGVPELGISGYLKFSTIKNVIETSKKLFLATSINPLVVRVQKKNPQFNCKAASISLICKETCLSGRSL